MKKKEFKEAVGKYSEAIALGEKEDPGAVYLLHSNRAQAYINLKDYDAAMNGTRIDTFIIFRMIHALYIHYFTKCAQK